MRGFQLFCFGLVFIYPASFSATRKGAASARQSDVQLFDRPFNNSFGVPPFYENAAKAIEWIQTSSHDVLIGPPGLARRMVQDEWPRIKADIDAGKPSPLMLVGSPQTGQGCSTLSTEGPLEECVDTAESGGVAILIER